MPILTEAQRNRLYSLHGVSPDEYDISEDLSSFIPRASVSEPSNDQETSVVLQQKPEVKAAPSIAESVMRSAAESALPTAASLGAGAGAIALSSWLGGPVTGIPVTAAALLAGIGGGIGALAVSSSNRKKRRKSSTSRKRNNSYRKTSRRQKKPYTAGKRKDTSRRRIRNTKNNQPYVILASGKARFISKKSVSNSRKRKGGKY